MKIFISGPITGNVSKNRCRFAKAAAKLRKKGHAVMNPAVLPDGFEYKQYIAICMKMIDCCDAVYMLKGWEESWGARQEYKVARCRKYKILMEE